MCTNTHTLVFPLLSSLASRLSHTYPQRPIEPYAEGGGRPPRALHQHTREGGAVVRLELQRLHQLRQEPGHERKVVLIGCLEAFNRLLIGVNRLFIGDYRLFIYLAISESLSLETPSTAMCRTIGSSKRPSRSSSHSSQRTGLGHDGSRAWTART